VRRKVPEVGVVEVVILQRPAIDLQELLQGRRTGLVRSDVDVGCRHVSSRVSD